MALDNSEQRAGGERGLSPMQIAHHPLFTAREKADLLQQLKAEVTGAAARDRQLGITAGEIDAALEEVKLGAQNGEQASTVPWGDN